MNKTYPLLRFDRIVNHGRGPVAEFHQEMDFCSPKVAMDKESLQRRIQNLSRYPHIDISEELRALKLMEE